jgi:lipopolysaccharide biosynthesis glycosyltransferase
MEDEEFKDCPTSAHFSKANYYRLKLPSLLGDYDKILYLDCDILVKKSLAPLYKIPFDDKYAVVVEDMVTTQDENCFYSHLCNLGINHYFNSGVMLLNLKKMREDNIEAKCFEFIKKSPEKIKWVDQCVLNAVFCENVKFVDIHYNFQYNYSIKDIQWQENKCKSKIIILHFVSSKKPWNVGNKHVHKWEYYSYLLRTPYKKEFLNIMTGEVLAYILTILKKIKITFRYLIKRGF